MKVWFDGEGEIACEIEKIKEASEDPGTLFVRTIERMPGLSKVELVDQGDGYVTIRTNEGLSRRTDISGEVDGGSVIVAFDEVYEAGSKVTATSHYRHEFTASAKGVRQHLVISGVKAPGLLGFLYRNLGKKSIGDAVLEANRSYFEDLDT